MEYNEGWYRTSRPRDWKGWGLSETIRLGVGDTSMRERWNKKGADGLGTFKGWET